MNARKFLSTVLPLLAVASILISSPALAAKRWRPLKAISSRTEKWLGAPTGTSAGTQYLGDCQSCGGMSSGCSACAAACGSCISPCHTEMDDARWWLRSEYLVWWLDGNEVPVLLTTSPRGTPEPQAGVLGQPGTSVLFGGEEIAEHEHYGGRWTLGYWFNDDRENGISLEYFSLLDGQRDGGYAVQSLGDPILARPFFNVLLGSEDSQLIAFDDATVVPAVDIFDGSVRIATANELHSGNMLLRRNLCAQGRRRLDMIGGYRYFRFREGLVVDETIIFRDPGGPFAIGTTMDVRDEFVTENDFHGGEFGLMGSWQSGPATLELVSKVALGNIHQQLAIDGQTIVTIPGGPSATSAGGLLTQPTNMGSRSRDEFGVLSEFDATLRLAASKNLHVTLGYSLVVLNDVLRTGDHIDRAVNRSQLGGNPLVGEPRPAAVFDEASFWAQGVSMGLEYRR